jgi:hypothetical protein
MSLATESRAIAAALAIAALAAGLAPPAAAPPRPSPSDLRDLLNRAEKSLRKAEGALSGRDPGRVSALLRAVDEQVARFETESRIRDLVAALAAGRAESDADDLQAASRDLARVRDLLPALSDYTLTREVEVAARTAAAATGARDAAAFRAAFLNLESAILAPVLAARLEEARRAVALGRAAMVRRDMAGGKAAALAARTALNGLRYAAALSQALFALRVSTDLIENGATMAARDQVRKGLKGLRLAAEIAPEKEREELHQAYERGLAVWRRMNKPAAKDAATIVEIAGAIQTIRERQS